MSNATPDRDSGSLTHSPYDPDPDLGDRQDEIPWKPPVFAAVAGALTVAIFVIYAIVTGPGVDEVSNDEVASAPSVTAQPTDDLPPGYVQMTKDVGARVELVTPAPSATFVSLSTAVPGSLEATTVRRLDVAYWELVTPAGTFALRDQFDAPGLSEARLGYITVEFSPDVSATSGEILAYVVDTTAAQSTILELPPDLPVEITDFRIDIGGGPVVVVDSLRINDDGAYVEWRVEGGLTARLDVIVRFVGSGESGIQDITLLPEYGGDFLLDPSLGEDPIAVPYAFGSQYRLVRFGALLDSGNPPTGNPPTGNPPTGNPPTGNPPTGNPPTGLSIEFRVSVVTSVAEPVSLLIG